MKLKLYQVDAFTSQVFSGNPAAVCPLDYWLKAEQMQKIAMENNLAETAFYVKMGDKYELRWFTPTLEVDLCGHATLAAAYVLFNFENHKGGIIQFISPRSGDLTVTRKDDFLTLNFPADNIEPVGLFEALTDGFNIKPFEAYRGKTDYMLVYENESQVQELIPSFEKIMKVDARGVIVTSRGSNSDFVSRFFAPQSGINEDPVTGSAHTTLTPYWANKLGKSELSAIQISRRRGYLNCKYLHDRVEISGSCQLYLQGEIRFE
jgi:PhzF family phenazine biosynthesis protein